MQQTETYKLNLIEKTDAFSPDALNENARTIEEALQAAGAARAEEASTRTAQVAGLEQRVTALEVHRIAVGGYTGTGEMLDQNWRTVPLEFTPAVIILQVMKAHQCELVAAGADKVAIRIVENGLQVCNTGGSDGRYNEKGTVYIFLALA